MTTYKEFQGKTLDEAIQEACSYYGVEREKLEVEIINDAKTGIFGLVSVKKAKIRAARVQSAGSLLEDLPAGKEQTIPVKASNEKPESKVKPPSPKKVSQKNAVDDKPVNSAQVRTDDSCTEKKLETLPFGKVSVKNSVSDDTESRVKLNEIASDTVDSTTDFLPVVDLEQISPEFLLTVVTDTLKRLISPIVGDSPLQVTLEKGRIRVHVDCGEESGLLVGREGQTLASVQYLACRIIGKQIGGAVRLHIDAGNYRERQDSRLVELANSLAEKVKATGKSQSTRLLSAYQRRIIHLALEGDTTLQTISKGEGSQRRVIIQLKKKDFRNFVSNDSGVPAVDNADEATKGETGV